MPEKCSCRKQGLVYSWSCSNIEILNDELEEYPWKIDYKIIWAIWPFGNRANTQAIKQQYWVCLWYVPPQPNPGNVWSGILLSAVEKNKDIIHFNNTNLTLDGIDSLQSDGTLVAFWQQLLAKWDYFPLFQCLLILYKHRQKRDSKL